MTNSTLKLRAPSGLLRRHLLGNPLRRAPATSPARNWFERFGEKRGDRDIHRRTLRLDDTIHGRRHQPLPRIGGLSHPPTGKRQMERLVQVAQCGRLQRPGQHPSPGWFAKSEWIWLAARAGLPCRPHVESSLDGDVRHTDSAPAHTVFVVGDTVVPDSVPGYVRDGSIALAKTAALSIVSLDFSERADGAWEFQDASAFPELMRGGDELLRAIADHRGDV